MFPISSQLLIQKFRGTVLHMAEAGTRDCCHGFLTGSARVGESPPCVVLLRGETREKYIREIGRNIERAAHAMARLRAMADIDLGIVFVPSRFLY